MSGGSVDRIAIIVTRNDQEKSLEVPKYQLTQKLRWYVFALISCGNTDYPNEY